MPLRKHGANPVCQTTGSFLQTSHVGSGAQDEQAPDIFVAAPADPQKIGLATCTVLPGNEPKRRIDRQTKQKFVEACLEPDAPIAGLALKHRNGSDCTSSGRQIAYGGDGVAVIDDCLALHWLNLPGHDGATNCSQSAAPATRSRIFTISPRVSIC